MTTQQHTLNIYNGLYELKATLIGEVFSSEDAYESSDTSTALEQLIPVAQAQEDAHAALVEALEKIANYEIRDSMRQGTFVKVGEVTYLKQTASAALRLAGRE